MENINKMSKTVIYTKPDCSQCEDTKNLFKELNLEFETVDIVETPEAREMLKSEGRRMMPVVKTENDSWEGFDPKKINALAGIESVEEDDDIWD